MAHWHDFNPWAGSLIYLPSLEEAASLCENIEVIDHWLKQSKLSKTAGKLDPYLLRSPRGHRDIELGVRWGKKPEEYFSTYIPGNNQALALELYRKYGGR